MIAERGMGRTFTKDGPFIPLKLIAYHYVALMGASADGPYKFEKTKDDMPTFVLWGRTLVTLVLIPLAVSAFRDEYGSVPLLNGIDLAVHEFGHPFFRVVFFGNETMTVLGGSLF